MNNIDFQNGFALGFTANGAGTGSSIQPDYLQNDPNAADYIKNRPFYEGGQVEIIFLPSADDGGLLIDPFGLQIGEEYLIYKEDPSKENASGTLITCVDAVDMAGFSAPMIMSEDPYIMMIEGVAIGDDMPVPGSQTYYASMKDLWLQIGGSIKKIDKKFLPDDLATKLKVATYDELGGVAPTEKTNEMTQEIGIDEDGRLFTVPVPEFPDIPSIEKTDIIQKNSFDVPTAGAVYSFLMDIFNEEEY